MLYNKDSAPDLEDDTLVENTLIIDQSYKWISLQADTLSEQTIIIQLDQLIMMVFLPICHLPN